MDGLVCDRCGQGLLLASDVRYEVRIEVKCAYDPMELTSDDLAGDLDQRMKRLLQDLEDASEQQTMDQVYRLFRFDLCPPCQKEYLADPLPRKPKRGP